VTCRADISTCYECILRSSPLLTGIKDTMLDIWVQGLHREPGWRGWCPEAWRGVCAGWGASAWALLFVFIILHYII
jgi:hypothetical protein